MIQHCKMIQLWLLMLITSIRKTRTKATESSQTVQSTQSSKITSSKQTRTHQSLDPLLVILRNLGRQSLSKVSGCGAGATSWRDWSPDRTSWLSSILISLVHTRRGCPLGHLGLCSLRTIRANWEQIWAPGPEQSAPNMGQMGEGAVKWALPLSCDIGWPGGAGDGQSWSGPGDFLRNFILMKSSLFASRTNQ